jgi:TolB-like protein
MRNVKKMMIYLVFCVLTLGVYAEDKEPQIYTMAILNFSEKGTGTENFGSQVADLLFSNLVTNDKIWLVERSELTKVLAEHELNLSGAVNPSSAIQVGQLSGAKILVTGSVFKVRNKTYLVAKIIGTETGRVLGESTNGTGDIDALASELSKKVAVLLEEKGNKLMPAQKSREDFIKVLKEKFGKKERPLLYFDIQEKHLQKVVLDPAAQTEFQLICKELGFELTEKEGDADLVIKGEGFSEFANRHGNLITVKARLEIKVTDKDGKIIAVDRQTDIALDLAEGIAGKKALQEASRKIAERMLLKIMK